MGAIYGTSNHGFFAAFGRLSLGSHVIDVLTVATTTGALKLVKSSTIVVTV